MARKLTDTVKLQVRLSERLRRRLEQAAKDNEQSMNTEIVSRLDESLQREELKKMIAVAIKQAIAEAATVTAGGPIPKQMARPQPPDKEEKSK